MEKTQLEEEFFEKENLSPEKKIKWEIIFNKGKEIELREKPKIDKFDRLMLKYGAWVRIGENRTYLKIDNINYNKPCFVFLCLFDVGVFSYYMAEIELENFDESLFLRMLKGLQFTGELIVEPDIEKFTQAAIYAMAGHFTTYSNSLDTDYAKYIQISIDLTEKEQKSKQ